MTVEGSKYIRPAGAEDFPFLELMLVEAAEWSAEPHRRTVEQVMSDPQVSHYIEGWPRPGDFGFVAISHQEEPIGACWVRLMPANDPGYGYVAPDVPELGIGVVREARGRGVGRALMRRAAEHARSTGVKRMSLSVERANPSFRLYESEGWRSVGSESGSDTMVLDLSSPAT